MLAVMAYADVNNVYIAGTGDDTAWCCGKTWDATGCPMPGGVYTVTVQPGTYYCKVVVEGSFKNWLGWDYLNADDSNPGVYKDGDGNMFFTVASEAEITVSYSDWSVVITSPVQFVEVPVTSWTLAGFGHYDVTDTNYDFTETSEGVFTLSLSDVSLLQGEAFYSAYANHEVGIKRIGGEDAIIPVTGVYDIDLTLVPATSSLTAELTKVSDITPDCYIGGTGNATNNWCCGLFWEDSCPMTEGVYTTTVQAGEYWFKVIIKAGDDTRWLGCKYIDPTTSTPGYVVQNPEYDGNIGFTVDKEAEITVSFKDGKISLVSNVPFANSTPTVWKAYLEDGVYPMPLVSDGKYQVTANNVTLYAQDYPWSVKGWYEGFEMDRPAVDYESSFSVGVAGVYNITFTVDTDNEEYGAALSLVTRVDETAADAIYAANGTIFSPVPFEVYNLSGMNVTAQNGNLNGIYIVKTADKAMTILVK